MSSQTRLGDRERGSRGDAGVAREPGRASRPNNAQPNNGQNKKPTPAPLGSTDLVRGALVIVTALAVGGFIFTRGLGRDGIIEEASETESDSAIPASISVGENVMTVTSPGQQTLDELPSVVTTPAPTSSVTPTTELVTTTERAPSEVTVLVVNGSGLPGIAGDGTQKLKTANFKTTQPRNGNETADDSKILYKSGYEAEAGTVASLFNVADTVDVTAIDPDALPVENLAAALADAETANIIVVIGSDDLIAV